MTEQIETMKQLPSKTVKLFKRVFTKDFLKQNRTLIIVLLLLCVYPIGPQLTGIDYFIHIGVIANIFAIIAIAWDINGGYTGQGNLAPGFFAGITGYTSAILTTQAGWPIATAVLLGIFLSFLSAVAIGFPSLRISGPYLVIVTFAVAEVARKLTIYFSEVTKGEEGIGGVPRFFEGAFANFYWTLLVLLVVYSASKMIMGSKWGLAFKAIAADETRAETLGISLMRYKIISFSICGVIAGIGGGLYAHYQAHIDPGFFGIIMAITIISMAVIGGEKTLLGPILGAYLLQFSMEGLRFVVGQAPWLRLSFHGLLLVVVMLFLPGGILSLFRKENADEGGETPADRLKARLRSIFFIEAEPEDSGGEAAPEEAATSGSTDQ
ncbi:MAG: branched-chain amino acid ABC transporter permease [Candidatus Thorarchaeota archaeon]